MRVGVFGAAGRMGRTVCAAVKADRDLELVAAIDPHHAGIDLGQATGVDIPGLQVAASADALRAARAQVAVDFTDRAAALGNLAWCAEHGVHAVVGTTGFSDEDLEHLGALFEPGRSRSNCLVAPNFAIGAVVMMRLAELAAPWFDSVEIIELHHDAKLDAPSGTARLTAERVAQASARWTPDPTRSEALPGARGAEGPAGIRVHSVRLRGLVAHQEVLFGTTGQSLTIRHDSYDRGSFMPGVVLAVKRIAERPGLTVGLDSLLDI